VGWLAVRETQFQKEPAMISEYFPRNRGGRRPAWEWPVGSLVRVRRRALLPKHYEPYRDEIVLVLKPVSKGMCSLETGIDWIWAQKFYCLKEQSFGELHPYDFKIVGTEPNEHDIFSSNY
jgi:hypothetical protein